jgi:hypothetical protein
MLRRSDEALRALDALPLDAYGRSTELRLIRAELRSRQDCASAEVDFAAVQTRTQTAEFTERALYGLGECRLKRGDPRRIAKTMVGRTTQHRAFCSLAGAAWTNDSHRPPVKSWRPLVRRNQPLVR